MESISNQPTPQDSGVNTAEFHSTIDTLSEQDEGTMTPPSKQTTPATSPQNSFRLGRIITALALFSRAEQYEPQVDC